MNPSMILEGIVAVLLIATIVYAFILNRRLNAWRRDKGELVALIGRFNNAAERAEAGIAALKTASEQTGQSLSAAIAKGQSLRDDFAYLIERAEPLADRMAARVREHRDLVRPEPVRAPAPAPAKPAPVAAEAGRSSAERDLLKALSALR
jgi:hypothetical protein